MTVSAIPLSIVQMLFFAFWVTPHAKESLK